MSKKGRSRKTNHVKKANFGYFQNKCNRFAYGIAEMKKAKEENK